MRPRRMRCCWPRLAQPLRWFIAERSCGPVASSLNNYIPITASPFSLNLSCAALSVTIFLNNIKVTFLAFAAGIVLGVGPAFLLLYNGAALGAVAGIAAQGGHTADVIELVAPHGVLELSCIAVCAAAGMRMGWMLIEPGTRSRREALAAEAPRAVLLVLATAPWLVLAGLFEGFVTPHHLALAAALATGFALAAPYWLFVLLRHSRKRALT